MSKQSDHLDTLVSLGYCPCCQEIHPQKPVGTVGSTQANGCDVDFTTWRCAGCGGAWSGDLHETGEAA